MIAGKYAEENLLLKFLQARGGSKRGNLTLQQQAATFPLFNTSADSACTHSGRDEHHPHVSQSKQPADHTAATAAAPLQLIHGPGCDESSNPVQSSSCQAVALEL